MDWREFVETMSGVEQKLREDPGGVYGKMDFATRDRYRHAVEKTAKASRLSESEVARKAIQLAHEGAASAMAKDAPQGGAGGDRTSHVGYYLIDKGLPQLERAAEVRLSIAEAVQRTGCRFPLLLYLGTIVLLTLIFTGSLLAKAHAGGLQGWILDPDSDPRGFVHQSSGDRAGQLGGNLAGDAAAAAAPGLFQREFRRTAARWWWSRPCSPARKTSRI